MPCFEDIEGTIFRYVTIDTDEGKQYGIAIGKYGLLKREELKSSKKGLDSLLKIAIMCERFYGLMKYFENENKRQKNEHI